MRSRTVDEVSDELRDRIAIEGARLSYRQKCAAMQRVHISPPEKAPLPGIPESEAPAAD